MNVLVSLDSILEPATAIVPATLFGTGQVETILAAIEKDVRAEAYDITTPEGRERIKSVAYKIARSKTTLDDIGKDHVADIKAKSAAIDKERKTLRDRLDALKEEVRGPLTAWEDAERERIAGHEAALVAILAQPHAMATAADLRQQKTALEALAGRNWEEFDERALEAFREEMPKLCRRIEEREQYDRDQAELAELRQQKAEREAEDRATAQEAIEAENARIRAEQQAEREREQASRIEREKQEAAERAAAEAVETERRRVAAEEARKAAEKAEQERQERRHQENKRHRAKVHKAIGEALVAHLFHDTPDAEGDELVSTIIEHIAAGRIPHVSINY